MLSWLPLKFNSGSDSGCGKTSSQFVTAQVKKGTRRSIVRKALQLRFRWHRMRDGESAQRFCSLPIIPHFLLLFMAASKQVQATL
jgi:hypothetical protein